jgi:lipid-A-disaccharide synthase
MTTETAKRVTDAPQMPAKAKRLFLVAGEHSGDNLGARLMESLSRQSGGTIVFSGIGGPAMAAQGLKSLFPLSELALMGLAEILPHLPRLMRRLKETEAEIRRLKPDLVVTIDSPGFTLRLAERLRGSGIPLYHYVAPQLWAWRPERGKKLAGRVDRILALLPFEPDFFARFQVPCDFVGHPVLESGADLGDAAAFCDRHGLDPEDPLVTVLLGSRAGEVRRHLPHFGQALTILTESHPQLAVALVTVDSQRAEVAASTKDWPCKRILVTDTAGKFDAFAASRAALTKSGTVNLELALAGLPMVVCHRLNPMTAYMARRLLTVGRVSLVNILAEKLLVPELLQEDCRGERIADELRHLLEDEARRREQIAGFREVIARLGADGPKPSDRAAEVILEALKKS